MASNMGKRGIQLFISVSHDAKLLKSMSQGLWIARLITRF